MRLTEKIFKAGSWVSCDQSGSSLSQSRSARVLTGANYDILSVDIIQTLYWDTLNARRLRAKSTLMYKILNDDTAPNLRNSFVIRNVNHTDYHLQMLQI